MRIQDKTLKSSYSFSAYINTYEQGLILDSENNLFAPRIDARMNILEQKLRPKYSMEGNQRLSKLRNDAKLGK